MTNYFETIHNLETGEITTRNYTESEIAECEISAQTLFAAREANEAKAQAKLAIFEQLGLTPEQAEILFS